jgi:hypothetical protein
MSQSILCPHCGSQIEISAALSTQVRDQIQKEFDAETRRRETTFAKHEQAIQQREQALEESRLSLERDISARLAQERDRLQQEARAKAQESVALDLQDLQGQLLEAKEKLGNAHQAELQLRKDRRDLEQKHQELELTVTRTLDSERVTIRDAAKQEAAEQHRLQEADRDRLIEDLRAQIGDLKRRSEQGSPQARGEVMELELEDILRDAFPNDAIEAVPVGAHGGDILHRVQDGSGIDCGSILWESKRTKNWNDAWLPKIRNDQRVARAHVAVITSVELPNDITHFGCIDGVWVTGRPCLIGLALALRHGLIEAARTRRSLQGRKDKVEVLYSYLAGSEFRQRVEGIVEAFMTLRDDLESEKRSMHRIWAKREKQLERAAINTSGLYGDLAGILGPNMPQIANLELATIAADADALLQEESCF